MNTARTRRYVIPRSPPHHLLSLGNGFTGGLARLSTLISFSPAAITTPYTRSVSIRTQTPLADEEGEIRIVNSSHSDRASTVQQQERGSDHNNALKEVHELLAYALAQSDLPAVAHAWSKLRQMDPLSPGVLPISYSCQYSELISELDLQGKCLGLVEVQALDELAASVTSRHVDGICARAHHYLLNNNPDATLHIIQMAYSYSQERSSRFRQLRNVLSPDEYSRIKFTSGDVQTIHLRCITYAIAACVMKDSFRPMLGLGVYDKRVESSLSQLLLHAPPTEELTLDKTRLQRWIRRFTNLRRLALEPATFEKYAAQAETSPNAPALVNLACSIVPELSEDEPCLTLDPAAAAASASEHPLVVLRDENWAQLMRSLIRARRVKEAERFWMDMTQFGAKIPMLVWAAVIEGFGTLKMSNRVRAAWDTFCSTRPGPCAGAVVYRAYIAVLFGENRPKDALAVFETFDKDIRKGPESIDSTAIASVYNTVLDWLVQQSRVTEARQIIERMKTSGPKPDVESYNIFIQHASRSRDLKAIADLIREMQALGMTGNVYTASVILSAVYLARTDAVELVLALLRQAGVQVDAEACNSLLDHLVRSPSDDAIAAAVQLLDHMETSPDIRSNELSYIRVLCGIERRVWKDVSLTSRYRRTVIEKMARQRRRLTRSVATRNVIDACFEHPGPEGVRRALIYYERYRTTRLRTARKFDDGIWCTLLHQLSLRGEWDIADELSREILESGQELPKGLLGWLDRVKNRVFDVAVGQSV